MVVCCLRFAMARRAAHWFPAKMEVSKRLLVARRRAMDLGHLCNQGKLWTEFGGNLLRAVTFRGQTAAARRSIGGERRDDDVAVLRDRTAQCFNVRPTLCRIREEMKNSAIVPDAKPARWIKRRHIRFEPVHQSGA